MIRKDAEKIGIKIGGVGAKKPGRNNYFLDEASRGSMADTMTLARRRRREEDDAEAAPPGRETNARAHASVGRSEHARGEYWSAQCWAGRK